LVIQIFSFRKQDKNSIFYIRYINPWTNFFSIYYIYYCIIWSSLSLGYQRVNLSRNAGNVFDIRPGIASYKIWSLLSKRWQFVKQYLDFYV